MSNKVAEIETLRPDRSVWHHEWVKANQLAVSVQKGLSNILHKDLPTRAISFENRSAEPPTWL